MTAMIATNHQARNANSPLNRQKPALRRTHVVTLGYLGAGAKVDVDADIARIFPALNLQVR
jgi:hypothetical protein